MAIRFFTQDKIVPMKDRVVYGDKLFFIGSCFAEEIGYKSRGLGFDAVINPFGVLFNPFSIAMALKRLNEGRLFSSLDVVDVCAGYYTTFWHNTKFWYPSPEQLLSEVNTAMESAIAHFERSKWVFVSLGTSWCYRHKATDRIVANCHKMPGDLFNREKLSVDQTEQLLADIVRSNPEKRFVFTVSPLRHLRDGLHENQLSKAILLLAVDAVCKTCDHADYFPAYEIMLDELRDYRYYKDDLFHPNNIAIEYIWDAFVNFGMDDTVLEPMERVRELKKMLEHKPFYPESDAYRRFVAERDSFAKRLQRDYPAVRLENLNVLT